jgi:predicted DNA-binding transcriptional regulator YafY
LIFTNRYPLLTNHYKTMYQPTTRVLTVLELLQAHPQINGTQLAKYLEVDVRSVRRYITMLQDLGIPVEGDSGRRGGYRLRPGYKPPPLIFSEDEVLAVAVGLVFTKKFGINTEAGSIESATAKIGRILPPKLREQVQAIQHSLVIDLNGADVSVESRFVTLLSLAVQQKRQINILYQSRDSVRQRTIDPYGVVYYGARWYMVGFCHLREGIRVFRLDRMQKVDMLTDSFLLPPNFNSLDYIISSIVAIPDRWNVKVLLSARLEEVRPLVPASLATLEAHPQGVLFKSSFDDLERMARILLGLGFRLVACEPWELRKVFEQLAEELSKIGQLE